MKKIMIIAALLIGANLSYGQTTPLTFKTSGGLTVDSTSTSANIYAEVTNTGSLSVTASVTFVSTPTIKNSNATIIPIVSNDGTNWSVVKQYPTNVFAVGTASTAVVFAVPDTLYKGVGTYAITDTASSYNYRFPIGYRYVGFKLVPASGKSAISVKGLAK